MSARARALASREREAQMAVFSEPDESRRVGFWRTLIVASAMAGGAGLLIYLLSPSKPPEIGDGGTPEDDETEPGRAAEATETTRAPGVTSPAIPKHAAPEQTGAAGSAEATGMASGTASAASE